MVRVAVIDHHGKTVYLQQILQQQGWLTNNLDEAQVVLADTDHPDAPPVPANGQWYPRHRLLEALAQVGKRIILYPHGANPQLDYDGLREPAPWVTAQLVHGQGHKDLYDMIGLDRPVHVTGWSYTPWRDVANPGVTGSARTEPSDGNAPSFLPLGRDPLPVRPATCLFAPIHPWANGTGILTVHKQANTWAYQRLLDHPAGRKIATLYGQDAPNGVTHRPKDVEFLESSLLTPVELIDQADHVIAAGTFAYTALARGKTVDLIDDGIPVMNDHGTQTVDHWEQIRPMVAYDGGTPDWVERWVGGPLNEDALFWLLEEYASG